jgi:hypothetical protein
VTCRWIGRLDHLALGQDPAVAAFGGQPKRAML